MSSEAVTQLNCLQSELIQNSLNVVVIERRFEISSILRM